MQNGRLNPTLSRFYLPGHRALIVFANHQSLSAQIVTKRLAKLLCGAIDIIISPPLFSVSARH